MRIAYLYPNNLQASWSVCKGAARTLKRMGHKVIDIPHAPGEEYILPPGLSTAELAIVSGPEHLRIHLERNPLWPPPCPVAGWLHESINREDWHMPIELVQKIAPRIYAPAWEDGQLPDITYLPFCTDHRMFRETIPWDQRPIKFGFIGTMYPKREAFLARISQHLPEPIVCGRASAETILGQDIELSYELYARSLNQIKVLVCLPMLSRLTGAKLFEAAACGCNVVAPHSTDLRWLFLEGEVISYDPGDYDSFIDAMLVASKRQLPRTGGHALESRLNRIIKET